VDVHPESALFQSRDRDWLTIEGATVADYPDHLSEGIAELSRLLVNEEALGDTLQRVADLACRTLEGADVAGVTMLQDGKPTTTVYTDPTSPQVDSAQYETGVGPCLDAFRHQKVFRIESTEEDEQWSAFSKACLEHGIMSTLSLPLGVRGNGIGALNLYAREAAAFSENDEQLGLMFASQASVALANAQIYESAYRMTQQLQEALTSRATIDQAKGMLMAQHDIGGDEAFNILRTTSQRENRKLRELAQEMVDRTRKD
jgi:GAF domain-containing protein